MPQYVLYSALMVIAKVSKAFSDENRIKIVGFLSEGPKNVSQVADKLNVEENLASHHLRVLAALGFLRNDKKGREVFYRINETKFISLIKDLKRNETFKDLLLKALED
jgi:DNA-binding transcriptional ArsR family regulator